MASGGLGVSRVTIVAPNTRVDLALPTDVALADLLPTVLRYAGEDLADDPSARHGWMLSRMSGAPLPVDQSPAQLDVRDGEVLYLRPRGSEFAEPIFDDVVDAVATSTHERAGRWRAATTRRFGLTVGVIILAVGVVMVLFSGPPQLPAALVGLAVGPALLVVAAVLSRLSGDSIAGVVFAVVALAYLGTGGLLLFLGDRPLTDLSASDALVAGGAVLLGSAVGTYTVAGGVGVFMTSTLAAVGLCVGALIGLIFGATPAAAAAVVATLALAALPGVPLASYRLAGLPVPSVPTDPAELKTDTDLVDGRRVLALSERADQLLGGMLGAVAVIGAVATVPLTATGGTAGAALSAALGLFLLLRARSFISRRQRLPLLIAGVFALGVDVTGAFLAANQLLRLTVGVGGTLALSAIVIAYAVAGAGRKRSPMWGRTLDIVETVVILAIVPLAVWSSGLYDWIRTIREG